jgi:hypothetical protein
LPIRVLRIRNLHPEPGMSAKLFSSPACLSLKSPNDPTFLFAGDMWAEGDLSHEFILSTGDATYHPTRMDTRTKNHGVSTGVLA